MNRLPRMIIGLLMAPSIVSAATPVTFGGAIFSRNSDAPRGAVIGDWNGDGLSDYAVTNFFDNSVSVAFGRGDGVFLETAGKVEVGAFPDQIVAGDWNRDGREDLALTNADEPRLSILFAEPGGGFRPASEVEIGPALQGLVVIDLNKDDLPDLAVISETGSGGWLSLLENHGGRFSIAQRYGFTGIPAALKTGDFDCDGQADIVVALQRPDRLEIRLSRHGFDRQEQSLALAAPPVALSIGDLDSDGASDVVVAFPTLLSLQIFAHGEAGEVQYGGSVALEGAPNHLALADLDGDGQLDAAVVLGEINHVQILRGLTVTGSADFSMLATGLRPTQVVVGDFNRDERPDLLVANHGGKSLSAFLNTTARSSRGEAPLPSPERARRCVRSP